MTNVTTADIRRLLDAIEAELAKIEAEAEPVVEPAPIPPTPAPDTFTAAEARDFLNKAGLAEVTNLDAATRRFQEAFNLGDALAVDGDFGPKTTAAAKASIANPDPKTGIYRVSAHFTLAEFKCKGAVHSADCKRTQAFRRLLVGMEKLRAGVYPSGLAVLSGYRCKAHNAAVGGASGSQHLNGLAFDPRSQVVQLAKVLALNIPELNGIGYNTNKTVSHCDARPAPRVTFAD